MEHHPLFTPALKARSSTFFKSSDEISSRTKGLDTARIRTSQGGKKLKTHLKVGQWRGYQYQDEKDEELFWYSCVKLDEQERFGQLRDLLSHCCNAPKIYTLPSLHTFLTARTKLS
ncbi:hypothetical protein L596_023160 [Steinernema carpocapsae]|uniref:Uncharacterized protein n=1 Tax=Steinernema carpocapsae TaxID=34508 RepID=A0A4U5MCU5_STECR|nr:hypothetical protein L596_023160 [Steinernema carpocapsae]